jgi:endonuclease/exonuclease/phosphatase family metal-dependent hydrolase
MLRRLLRAAPLAAVAVLAATAATTTTATAASPSVTVMTRNLFLGTDLPTIALGQPGADFEARAGRALDEVKAGDPAGRMKLVAAEIAKAKPDLVGLQEVTLWRTGPKGDPAPATTVLYDFLGLLRKELKRLHAPYRVVVDRRGLNVEGPTDRGVDVRITIGDTILARSGVKVTRPRSGIFTHQLVFNTAQLGQVNPSRTWNSVDATVRGAKLHLVNAHLEAYSPGVRLDQAKELVAGPLKSKLPTILVGDINSGPNLPKPEDRPPYAAIHAAGFEPRRAATHACCLDTLAGGGAFDHDVDWIMSKPGLKLLRSYVTGRTEKTPTGQHASDHAGVVSVLRLKR